MSEPRAFYNEFDPAAAAWLRKLIEFGLIPDGDVDERSITDVQPEDLEGYTQVHLFAGIGVWAYALRLAGWPDHRPVWTGSCPCPPFSNAGKGQRCPECGSKANLCHPRLTGYFICRDCGCSRYADERHLWPDFSRLVRECRPAIVFGEQVASADGRLWLDTVSADLEEASYGVAGADLCAAGFGAPHLRQRLFFGAYDTRSPLHLLGDGLGPRLERHAWYERYGARWSDAVRSASEAGLLGGLDQPSGALERGRGALGPGEGDSPLSRPGAELGPDRPDIPRGLAEHGGERRGAGRHGDHRGDVGSVDGPDGEDGLMGIAELLGRDEGQPGDAGSEKGARSERGDVDDRPRGAGVPGPVNGRWRAADWLFCRDERWRAVEPGTFPLAHGLAARVVRLRGYGNAIVSEVGAGFICDFDAAIRDIIAAAESGGLSLDDLEHEGLLT